MMSISPAEIGAMFFHTLTNSIGLVGNGLLLYLVLMKSPKNIKTYSVLMFNFALTDFCGCLFALFVQQRIIPIGWSLAYISSGPCKYFGPLVCYVSYSAMLHCYAHSLYSLLLSFIYRYYVLKSRNLTARKLVIILIAIYPLSFFQFIIFCFASDDPTQILPILHKRFPEYETSGHMVSGSINIFEWKALFTILHMTLPVSPIYVLIIWIRSRIIKTLQGHKMSESTKTMHKQLLNALTFQAVLPGLFLIAVITYALGQTGLYNHPLLEFSTFLVIGVMPVISPLGTLYYIRPYQQWIRKNVLRQEMAASSIQPSNVYSTANGPSDASFFQA